MTAPKPEEPCAQRCLLCGRRPAAGGGRRGITYILLLYRGSVHVAQSWRKPPTDPDFPLLFLAGFFGTASRSNFGARTTVIHMYPGPTGGHANQGQRRASNGEQGAHVLRKTYLRNTSAKSLHVSYYMYMESNPKYM